MPYRPPFFLSIVYPHTDRARRFIVLCGVTRVTRKASRSNRHSRVFVHPVTGRVHRRCSPRRHGRAYFELATTNLEKFNGCWDPDHFVLSESDNALVRTTHYTPWWFDSIYITIVLHRVRLGDANCGIRRWTVTLSSQGVGSLLRRTGTRRTLMKNLAYINWSIEQGCSNK